MQGGPDLHALRTLLCVHFGPSQARWPWIVAITLYVWEGNVFIDNILASYHVEQQHNSLMFCQSQMPVPTPIVATPQQLALRLLVAHQLAV